MDDEQLYYKDKYLKYKLKYLTLKEQLDGGSEKYDTVHTKVRKHLSELLTNIKGNKEYIIINTLSRSNVYNIDDLITEELKPNKDSNYVKYSLIYDSDIIRLLNAVVDNAQKQKYIKPEKEHKEKLYEYLYKGVKNKIYIYIFYIYI
jgi:hypothetical protein